MFMLSATQWKFTAERARTRAVTKPFINTNKTRDEFYEAALSGRRHYSFIMQANVDYNIIITYNDRAPGIL